MRSPETNKVLEYYDQVWLERFKRGLNPISLAMHYGFYAEGAPRCSLEEHKLRMNDEVINRLGLGNWEDTKSVLDAGCGIGGTAIYFAQHYPDTNVCGITLSHEQALLGHQLVAARSLEKQVSIITGDYHHIPVGTSMFHASYAIESSCHADKEIFLKEIERILVPGGRLVIADIWLTDKPMDTEQEK
ncbi:MAG: class I SAM-dependent methyltransferase [Candidatus Shapirobacteria bacterium]